MLLARFTGWRTEHVMEDLLVRLHCSARVVHPTGETRTYWATEIRYPFYGGRRRDFVEIDLGDGTIGLGQLIVFVTLENMPPGVETSKSRAVLIRWLSPSSLSRSRDDYNRPLCAYPLSSNHCLWEWSDAGNNRRCFTRRGFHRTVEKQNMWGHVSASNRRDAINSEKRAFHDFIEYDSIIRHANVAVDPTTGHLLQTLHIV